MKKISLLLCALGIMISPTFAQRNAISKSEIANAQVAIKAPQNKKKMLNKEMVLGQQSFDGTRMHAPKVVAEKWDTTLSQLSSYHVDYSFNLGFESGLINGENPIEDWYIYPGILVPYMDTIKFVSDYNADLVGDWSDLNNQGVEETVATGVSTYEEEFGYIGDWLFSMPWFTITTPFSTTIDDAGDSTVNFAFKKYQYAGTYCDYLRPLHINDMPAYSDYFNAWFRPYIHAPGSMSQPMTYCAMVAESDPDKVTRIWDCWGIGAGDYGKYAYGTKLNIGSASAPVYADTIGVFVQNLDIMYIDSVFLPVYREITVTDDDGNVLKSKVYEGDSTRYEGEATDLIPEGGSVVLKLYPVINNQVQRKVVIAEAVATKDDLFFGDEDGEAMMLFCFKSKDGAGYTANIPAIVKGDFYAELTNFNESNCDFGIFSDYYNQNTYTTYFVVDGEYDPLWPYGGNNIAMSFNAMFPVIIEEEEITELEIDKNGGEAHAGSLEGEVLSEFSYFTNIVNLDEWNLSGADWLDFDLDSLTNDNDEFVVNLKITARANTESAKRTADITIKARGQQLKFKVSQEGGGTGIEAIPVSASKVAYNNGEFQLRYDASYNNVDVFAVNGQRVASYNLPKTGRFNIDATDLANGVYLLQLNGAQTETLRVVK